MSISNEKPNTRRPRTFRRRTWKAFPARTRLEQSALRFDSVYFDTQPDNLLDRGITLRCRIGTTPDRGWQPKIPAGDARTELRLDPTAGRGTVPRELAQLTLGSPPAQRARWALLSVDRRQEAQ